MVVRQMLLSFEGGDRERGDERNSSKGSTVQQATAARKEAEATSTPLLDQVNRTAFAGGPRGPSAQRRPPRLDVRAILLEHPPEQRHVRVERLRQ